MKTIRREVWITKEHLNLKVILVDFKMEKIIKAKHFFIPVLCQTNNTEKVHNSSKAIECATTNHTSNRQVWTTAY